MPEVFYFDFPKDYNLDTCLTIGNFDGVHLGHQHLIEKTVQKAHKQDLQAGVITFDPHPITFFRPDLEFSPILSLEDRVGKILELGVDFVFVQSFTQDLSDLTPLEYIENILIGQLHCKQLIIGSDFTIGKNRAGDRTFFEKISQKGILPIEIVDKIELNNQIVSSTRIRQLIGQGRIEEANELLGYRL